MSTALKIALGPDVGLGEEARKSVLEQIYYVDSRIRTGRFSGDALELELELEQSDSPMAPDLEARIVQLCERTATSFSRVTSPVLFEHQGNGSCRLDPHGELRASRQLIETGVGIAAYRGNLLRLIRGLDRLFRNFALSQGADEQEYPTTVRARALAENGYLSSFPQHALFAAAVHADLGAVDNVAATAKQPLDGEALSLSQDVLERPRQVLAPTVCHHCFETLRGQSLDPARSVLVTALGRCHRHEYRTTAGLERLQTFTMRELIFLGDEATVVARRNNFVEFARDALAGLGLTMRIIASSDPFFAIEAANKRSFQSILGLKQELQLLLPYSGKWLAVGSVNNHRDTLVRAYGITSGDAQRALNSGCVGFGYERMALGVLAQFGTDIGTWPIDLRGLIA